MLLSNVGGRPDPIVDLDIQYQVEQVCIEGPIGGSQAFGLVSDLFLDLETRITVE